jgi:hypothetical protein
MRCVSKFVSLGLQRQELVPVFVLAVPIGAGRDMDSDFGRGDG